MQIIDRNSGTGILRIAFVVAVVFIVRHASGQESDGSSPDCDLCSSNSGWEFDVSAGMIGIAGDDVFKFGDYTGLDEEGITTSGDLFLRYWGEDANFLKIEGYRLGLDSRAIFVEGGKQGNYEWRASYQGIPRRIYDSTSTPFRTSGRQELNLLSGWDRAPTTQGMASLDDSLQQVKIERDWDIYNLGVAFSPATKWTFDLNYRHQEREGNAISSGNFVFDSTMFAAPIDDSTDEIEVTAVYDADWWQINTTYWGVVYDNKATSLAWDNPYTAVTPGTDSGNMARTPDNESHQIRIAGSMVLPARTTVTGHASIGRMNQNDSFLAYTTNSQIATTALPSNSANAQVDNQNLLLRVTSSPTRKITLEGQIRSNERDNETPQHIFDYVVTDSVLSDNSATNIAYDYKRDNYRLRGEYRFTSRTRFYLGYDYENFHRTSQERTTAKTDLVWAKLRTQLLSVISLDIKLYAEGRNGSEYEPNNSVPNPQNLLMRKYNMADRERTGFKADVSAFTTQRFGLGLNAEYNNDDYTKSEMGLLESEHLRLGLDASYLLNDDVSIYGSVYREDVDAKQANSQAFSMPDWQSDTEDSFITGSLGLRIPNPNGRWSTDVQYLYSQSESNSTNNTNALVSSFPELESTLHQIRLGFSFHYSENLDLQANYFYEGFSSRDWALDDVEVDTVPNLLSLDADPWDYNVHSIFLGIQYRFDTRGQSGARMANRFP
ncbi:MAG: hypothetical protein DRR11_11605 [Gammaproteobacteria bacterium]|nr:MAG: hypothetical protein DRR11_11605 [Gammaproteobacteria bacterium]RLA35647.1 MAG: hypothetical protein DRR15_07025 [Gammaproteobacteria bacterium]